MPCNHFIMYIIMILLVKSSRSSKKEKRKMQSFMCFAWAHIIILIINIIIIINPGGKNFYIAILYPVWNGRQKKNNNKIMKNYEYFIQKLLYAGKSLSKALLSKAMPSSVTLGVRRSCESIVFKI
jgi:hypothetical protein